MKKIALMITTLFALTNIVVPSTVSYALNNIESVKVLDENSNSNEIIEENLSEENTEEDIENIISENVENNVENQEDIEALEEVTEDLNINNESDISNDEAQEKKEISKSIDNNIYEKVKKNPKELNDFESDIQLVASERSRTTRESIVDDDIYIAAEDVEYHVKAEGDEVILVGEYTDGTIETSKEVAIYDDALIEQLEQEEFKANYENALNFEYLVKKTDANYEIVEAYSDGSFKYIESADTIGEAMSIALNEYESDEAIPCVIDNYGVVVYSTNAMARFLSIQMERLIILTLLYYIKTLIFQG